MPKAKPGDDTAGTSSVGAGRVFISYRREETAYPAGWLFDRLSDHFGEQQIFKDIDSIEPGDDFVQTITAAVGSCDVLLALIGDEWLTIADQGGRRRLDDVNDFVRVEIEAALSRNVRVIPILVEGAAMPHADDLPPSLAGLVRRQAMELSPSRFATDLGRLLRVLERTLAETPRRQPDPEAGLPAAPPPAPPSDVAPHRSLANRSRAVFSTPARVAAAVLAVLVVLVLVIFLATRGPAPSGGDSPSDNSPASSEEAPSGAGPAPSLVIRTT